MRIKDNFLDDKYLIQLEELINNPYFAWYLNEEQTKGADDGCWFSHLIYDKTGPKELKLPREISEKTFSCSEFSPLLIKIFNNLNYVDLYRITINLLLRQKNQSISAFHTDFEDEIKITTAIFYLNTNNGYTEFENGDKIDCIRNRLIMFPVNTLHRAVGCTDVNKRIVLNFNFLNIHLTF